jgi:hypothetical protein
MKTLVLLSIFLLTLTPFFGQQNDLVQPDDQPCTYEIPSNAFENGLLSPSEGTQIVANDILVAADDTFTINQVIVTFFTQTIISDADIRYYADDNGLPGSVLHTMTDTTPTIVFDVGSFGIFAWKAIFDVPNFDFVAQSGVETRYWISVTVSNTSGNDEAYWETSTATLIGLPAAINDGTGWILHDPGTGQNVDCVYEFIGECTLSTNDYRPPTTVVYPNPSSDQINIIIPNTLEINSMTVYDISGKQMDVPSTANTIDVSNLPNGLYILNVISAQGLVSRKLIKN